MTYQCQVFNSSWCVMWHECDCVAVLQVCEQTGEDLVMCEGQCCGSYHLHCIGLERSAEKVLCTACSSGEIHWCHVVMILLILCHYFQSYNFLSLFQVCMCVSPVRSLKERCGVAVFFTVAVSTMRRVCSWTLWLCLRTEASAARCTPASAATTAAVALARPQKVLKLI